MPVASAAARFPPYQTVFTYFRQWRLVKPPHKPKGEYAALLRDFLGDEGYLEHHPDGFRVLARCWAVERTFAWLVRQRRLSKDYEGLSASLEAGI
jgi:transposase